MEQYVRPIEAFTVGSAGPVVRSERVLSTVLFTDIVDSTARATTEGDRSWSALLDDHDRICRRAVDEAGGRIVKMTGDGVLATFDGPAAAIAAAQAMSDNLGVLGLEIRSGVHTGEIERRGDDIGGIGVNIAARIMGCASGGEVWASSTVPGLSAGSGVVFSPAASTRSRASTACRTSSRSAAPPSSISLRALSQGHGPRPMLSRCRRGSR